MFENKVDELQRWVLPLVSCQLFGVMSCVVLLIVKCQSFLFFFCFSESSFSLK